MGRKKKETKINMAKFIYNGNSKAFDNFIKAVVHDYLNSSEMPQTQPIDFVEKVDFSEKNG